MAASALDPSKRVEACFFIKVPNFSERRSGCEKGDSFGLPVVSIVEVDFHFHVSQKGSWRASRTRM